MIELKTEVGSHRRDQIPMYFDLAAHHYPGCQIDITYLTPTMERYGPLLLDGWRFSHVTWDRVFPLVVDIWGGAETDEWVNALKDIIESIGEPWRPWLEAWLDRSVPPAPQAADLLEVALALAAETSADGQQRSLDHRFESLDVIHEFRLELRDLLVEGTTADQLLVRPWVWSMTTDGRPLTDAGAESGYELRVSRDTKLRT